MSTTVYKLLKKAYDGNLFSCSVINPRYMVKYSTDETNYPPKFNPRAWLLAFETEQDAISFYRSMNWTKSDYCLYEARASKTKPCDALGEWIDLFWDKPKEYLYIMKPPHGTVWCKDITLIEELHP